MFTWIKIQTPKTAYGCFVINSETHVFNSSLKYENQKTPTCLVCEPSCDLLLIWGHKSVTVGYIYKQWRHNKSNNNVHVLMWNVLFGDSDISKQLTHKPKAASSVSDVLAPGVTWPGPPEHCRKMPRAAVHAGKQQARRAAIFLYSELVGQNKNLFFLMLGSPERSRDSRLCWAVGPFERVKGTGRWSNPRGRA